MKDIVHIHEWEYWGNSQGRSNFTTAWREDLTLWQTIPPRLRERDCLKVHLNGRRVDSELWHATTLSPGDHVDVSIRPQGGEVIAALVQAAIAASVSLVISLILPKPKGPKRRGDTESANYAWDGKDNTRVEGQPRAPWYGEMRGAPQIIDTFVKTQQVPARSDLWILMSLGEGPIHSIGGITADNPVDRPLKAGDPSYPLPVGIEVNGNPLENFRGVEAHVRLGTSEQLGIPGFEEIHTVSEVGSTLTQAETSATTNTGTAWLLSTFPYNSNDSSVQAVWNNHAQAFDLPAAADAYTATINFPEGLYRIDAGGNLQDAYFRAFVRYRELDALGDPITTGGDNGDGWVYAAPTAPLVARHQSAFPYELSGPFYTSAGFTPGVQGRILQADATTMYAITASANGVGNATNAVTPWTAGNSIDEFTWEGWYKPATLPTTGTGGSNTIRPIFEWMTNATNYRGISIMLRRVTVDVGSDTLQERWRLSVYYGNETATLREFTDVSGALYNTGVTNFPAVRWYHVAVTYKRNASGIAERWRIYIDGSLAQEFTTNNELVAAAAPFQLARTAATPNGTVAGFGRFDEVRVWRTERSAQQVSDSYNGGAGTFGISEASLVAGWHFDNQDNLVNFTFAGDYSSNNNRITTVNGAVVGEPTTQADAVVFRTGSGTLKRARYRVQILRFNLKSTSSAIGDKSEWQSLDGRIDEMLSYPNTPLLGLRIPATDQLNTTAPTVTVVSKGRVLKIWDGLSAVTPSFTEQWSANPAWIAYDVITNPRYGRGGDFDFSRVDLVSMQEWADYCDERIYDGLGRTAISSTGSTSTIQKVFYDSTLNAGAGGIELYLRVGQTVPAQWKEGGYLGLNGMPIPPTTGILVNVNVPHVAAMQITSIYFNGGVWVVRLAYDKATLGDPWADASFLDAVVAPAAVVGTAEGREERFRFDGIFDTFQKVWDVLLQIGGTARAMPVMDGSRIRFRIAKPRSPVGIVGKGQIEPKSFKVEYSSRVERPNLYVTDFLDRDQNWKQKPAERSDRTLAPGSSEGAINRDNIEMVGIVRRSQVLRDMDFRLAVNRTLTKQGEFVTGIEGLLYEVGDVITLAHDLVPWGKSGRIPIRGSGTTVAIDRSDVSLDPLKTYYLRVRMNATGQTGSGSTTADYYETREVTGVGAVTPTSTEITIASAFTVAPNVDDPYVLFAEDEEQLVEIAEMTLTPDFKRKIRWIAYDEDVYDVDTLPSDIPTDLQLVLSPGAPAAGVAPAAATKLSVSESQRLGADGVWTPEVLASWNIPSTEQVPSEVVVWARSATESTSPWEVVAQIPGPATSARFRSPVDAPGTPIEVAVQLVGQGGTRLQPEQSTRIRITLSGNYTAPPAPTNLTATMDGDQVTYRWTPPENARGLVYELRRGGWALGQVIGTAPEGSTSLGPTRDWAASKDNFALDGPPRIECRARDSRGQYSAAAILTGFNPSVPGAATLSGNRVVGRLVQGDLRYEDWAPAWTVAGPPSSEDPTLAGLIVATNVAGRAVLRFDAGYTEGTYTSGIPTISATSTADRTYVEAFVIADQVAPITDDQITLADDDPRAARRTDEGLLDSPKCTLRIQWRYRTLASASYGDWSDFKPGLYHMLDSQFRLLVTRPDETWNVEIRSFGVRLSRTPIQRFQRTDARRRFEASLSAG